MRKEITLDTMKELSDQLLLRTGKYFLSEHYLIIEANGDIYWYLKQNNYNIDGEICSYKGKDEVRIIYINRKVI